MALFGKKEEINNQTELERYNNRLKNYYGNVKVQEVSNYLKGVIGMVSPNLFEDDELLIQVVEKYLSTHLENDIRIEEYVQMVKNVFSQVYFSNKVDSVEMKMFLKL